MTKSDTTLKQFRLKSPAVQWEHVDITKAPSYAAWYKAALRAARRLDRRRGDKWHEQWLEERKTELGQIGYALAYETGRVREYAAAVAREIGLHPCVNQGRWRGTEFLVEELYALLPEAKEAE